MSGSDRVALRLAMAMIALAAGIAAVVVAIQLVRTVLGGPPTPARSERLRAGGECGAVAPRLRSAQRRDSAG
jgi:hypothetical protein